MNAALLGSSKFSLNNEMSSKPERILIVTGMDTALKLIELHHLKQKVPSISLSLLRDRSLYLMDSAQFKSILGAPFFSISWAIAAIRSQSDPMICAAKGMCPSSSA